MISDLPLTIQNHILAQVNGEYVAAPNTFSLTELLYCIRKAYFARVCPKPFKIEAAWYIYRGNLLDESWTPLFPRHQVRSTHRCQNIPVVIVGKYDFLSDEGVLTDLKTMKTLKFLEEPKEEHVKQVRFYAWTNAIEKAQLIYVDFGDAKVFPVEVGDCHDLLEELEEKATLLWTALQNGKAPPKNSYPDFEWMCRTCEYKEECAK